MTSSAPGVTTYNKFIVAVLVPLILGIQQALVTDTGLDLHAWSLVVATALGAIGVLLVPNTPVLYWAKALVGVLSAGFVASQVLLEDNAITGPEWLTLAVAVLGAVAVYLVPNRNYSSVNSTAGAL